MRGGESGRAREAASRRGESNSPVVSGLAQQIDRILGPWLKQLPILKQKLEVLNGDAPKAPGRAAVRIDQLGNTLIEVGGTTKKLREHLQYLANQYSYDSDQTEMDGTTLVLPVLPSNTKGWPIWPTIVLPSAVWDGTGNVDLETIAWIGKEPPDGYHFSIIVPRTAAETGGTQGATGNYVRAVHGAGNIICQANRKNGGPFSYRAYADNNDNDSSSVSSAALYEKLDFVWQGGNAVLIGLPASVSGSNANGEWELRADGTIYFGIRFVMPGSGAGTRSIVVNFPIVLSDAEWLGNVESRSFPSVFDYIGFSSASDDDQASIAAGVNEPSASTVSFFYSATGRWKPQD